MVESNREAVIAIQGGGVYALSLLGQAQAVLERGYVPLAFAGTSGGAILASLLWSGLSPQQIQAEFIAMLEQDPQALLNLLSPFEPPPKPHFDYTGFLDLQQRVKAALASINAEDKAKTGWWSRTTKAIPGMWNAERATLDLWSLWKLLQPHIRNRGLFNGHKLEKMIDGLIRKGLGNLPGMPPPDESVTFGHVAAIMKKNRGFFRPPLLLTATNLSRRKLELFNSVDPRYSKLPVAAAVRASAGFPGFFRPRAYGDDQIKEWLVDGGVIANFPIWAFSEAFREQISQTESYSAYAWRPWIRIGLRVVGDETAPQDLSDPGRYFAALFGMVTGAARNELEDILAGQDPRSIVIRQRASETNGPGVLAVSEVDADRIRDMVDLGHRTASRQLDGRALPHVYTDSPALHDLMKTRLASLVQECELVLGASANPKLRANIFIPIKNTLNMLFSHNMEGDDDDGLVFPNLSTGVAGACYQLSTPLVCNLTTIAELLRAQPEAYKRLFNMTPDLQKRVKTDRTWLMSVPIFDPHEVKVRAKADARPPAARTAACDLGIGLRGPLLGVLNLDAALNYAATGIDPDQDLQSTDSRIRAISAIMQAAALAIGTDLTT